MKKFLDDDFLLNTDTASELYHDYAEPLPLIDFHSHLNPFAIDKTGSLNSFTDKLEQVSGIIILYADK